MNRQKWFFNTRVCWPILVAYLFIAFVPSNADAFLAQSRLSSGEIVSERGADIASIQSALENKVVTQRLADYGLTPEEVDAKLGSLSDEQLHQLAGLSGDVGGGVLGAVIAVLLVILLVVLILHISDKRIVIS
ncbi:MAG: PA2779 family protein [Desulfomicrobium apsheronum]|nr:PA2779 family protein [Desulfomicrobium apsheronum]